MRNLLVGLVVAGCLFGQRGGGGGAASSPTGFGRMAYPGAGAPAAGPSLGGAGFGRMIYPGTGAPAVARSGAWSFTAPPFVAHAPHVRGAVVPYPIFYGGGYYGTYEPPPAATPLTEYDPYYPSQRAPVVIINQNFRPDTANPVLHDYTDSPLPESVPQERSTRPQREPARGSSTREPNAADEPTIYLIALKDGSILASIAYWVQGELLNYVTRDASPNHVSLDLVDRELSKRLNDERQVEFKLPPTR